MQCLSLGRFYVIFTNILVPRWRQAKTNFFRSSGSSPNSDKRRMSNRISNNRGSPH